MADLVEEMARAMAQELKRDCVNTVSGECYAHVDNGVGYDGAWNAEVDGEIDLLQLAQACLAVVEKRFEELTDLAGRATHISESIEREDRGDGDLSRPTPDLGEDRWLIAHSRDMADDMERELPNGVGNTMRALCDLCDRLESLHAELERGEKE